MTSPSQLFSCVDATALLRSPINNSTAKHHWSFSKSERFANPKLYCDRMYDLPPTQSARKAGIGYGKKTDLQVGKNRHNVAPSPDTYNLQGFIETNQMHSKGPTPGKGREEVAPVSYIPMEGFKIPGPGTYSPAKSKDTPDWSMRPRTTSQLFQKTTQRMVPGPGRYENAENLNKSGRYYTSKHSNSKSKIWNPKRSKRFNKSTTDAPGPGTYKPVNDMSASGDYVLSNNISAGKRKLMMGSRDSFVEIYTKRRTKTPGPGSYRQPSDFGHYDQMPNNTSMMVRTARSRFIS